MRHLKKFSSLNEAKSQETYTISNTDIKKLLSKFASDFLNDYEKEHVGSPEAMVDEWISNNLMSYKNYSHSDLKK
jgi:hypothetical protein